MKKNKRIPILSLIGVLAVVAAFTGVLFSGLPITATAVDVSEINTPYPYNQAEFDNYTDSDLLYPPASGQAGLGINDYKGQLLATGSAAEYGQEHDMIVSISSDDPIIRIIPRRLFERRGTYLHIGREYGFYVETTQLDDTNIYENKSVVLVFDIIKYPLNNGNYPSQYAIEIKPVFEYTYYYLTDNNNFASDNDDLKYNAASLSSAVVAVPVVEWLDNSLVYYYRETKTHFLKDMSFGLSLYNEQELNIGDGGYDKNADNGSFITRANVNFSGVSNQALLGSSVLSTFKFGLGFIKYVGDVISIAEYGYELFTNEANDFRGNVGYGDYYNTQYYNSKAEQLAHYANLNKSAVVELLSDDPRPLLFGRTQENNYVRGVFTLGMTEDWYTRTIDTVKLSVVTESTNWFTGNSDITSRTTAERSARGNIRTLQGKPITLESAKSFTLLPNGITKFDFAAEYASDYTLDITNGSQMSVKIDNAAVSFSGNQTTKALSAGTHEIEIQGNNASKLTSSISVAPKTIAASTANTSITIPAYANYAVKITSLAQVKALSTNISSVVIKAIFTNNSWSNYVLYGAISPTSKLTHPFVPGNYYALLENKTASSIAIPFTIAE
ncbi:MAG: hypothetical protein LBS99_03670, partial [Clostridiales bacterium]|nr:hypothetical protein [Clostridiales bacterium]